MERNDSQIFQYSRLSTLAYLVTGIFGAIALCSFFYMMASALIVLLEVSYPGNRETILTIFSIFALVGTFESLLRILVMVLFLVWIYQATKNLIALKVDVPEYTPGWAVGWWFIPILNIYSPMAVVRSLWNQSDPAEIDNDGLFQVSGGTPWLIICWWLCFIASNIGSKIVEALAMSKRTAAGIYDEIAFFILIASVLQLAAAVLIMKIVIGINARQESRFEKLRAMVSFSPPVPPQSFS